tara:strand:+ start:673 stop:960 length:288 start_codon:yes stop_codon:yes gene_type:complete
MNAKFLLPIVAASSVFLVACGSSPAEKQIEAQTAQIEAQAELTVEKKKTVKQYKECVMKSKGNETSLKMCEALLKVVNENSAATVQPVTLPATIN